MFRIIALGLFVCALWPGRVLAFGNCLDAGYLNRFTEGAAPEACQDIYYTTIVTANGPTTLRAIRLADSPHRDDSAWITPVNILAAAIGPAIDAIGSARLPREITLMLNSRGETAEVAGDVIDVHGEMTDLYRGECTLNFFKLPTAVEPEEFTFTLAHEIFHCAQYQTWPGAMGVGDDWWVEGSAEYFANLAVPGSPYGWNWINAFDTDSLTRSITDMAYANVVFFTWIDNRDGPAGVGAFLDQMRRGDQTAVLRSLVPHDQWISFIETWLDGQIRRPGGGAIVPAPYAHFEKVFRGPDELPMETDAYVIPRWGATFAEDKRFDLTLTPGSGAPTVHMRVFEGGDWAEPPPSVNTCDEEKRYIVYAATIDGPADATLAVETDEDTTGGACCLIGEWKPTAEALDGFANFGLEVGAGVAAAQGINLTCQYDSGDWLFSFRDDGTGRLEFRDNTNECSARANGGRITVISSRTGTSDFNWWVAGEEAGMIDYASYAVLWMMTMKIGPVSQTMPGEDSGPAISPHGFFFTCEGDAMTVNGIYGLSHKETPHVRVVAPE